MEEASFYLCIQHQQITNFRGQPFLSSVSGSRLAGDPRPLKAPGIKDILFAVALRKLRLRFLPSLFLSLLFSFPISLTYTTQLHTSTLASFPLPFLPAPSPWPRGKPHPSLPWPCAPLDLSTWSFLDTTRPHSTMAPPPRLRILSGKSSLLSPFAMGRPRLRVCAVGGNAISAFLSWRLQATTSCDVTLVWKSEAVSQYGVSFKYVSTSASVKSPLRRRAFTHRSYLQIKSIR